MDEDLEQIKDLEKLMDFVKNSGWVIAFPSGGGEEDDGNLHGMIIGEPAYVDYVLKHLD